MTNVIPNKTNDILKGCLFYNDLNTEDGVPYIFSSLILHQTQTLQFECYINPSPSVISYYQHLITVRICMGAHNKYEK